MCDKNIIQNIFKPGYSRTSLYNFAKRIRLLNSQEDEDNDRSTEEER